MAYAALSTIQTIAAGEVFTAATLQQANDDLEFLIDPPACSIKETTAQSTTTGTPVALTSDEENFDNDSMHSTSSLTSRITVQTAGRYLVSGTVLFDANATGARQAYVKVNGTTDYDLGLLPAPSSGSMILTGVRAIVCAASDYLELYVSQTSGGNLNVTMREFAALFITR